MENEFYGGGANQSLQRTIPLGTGSVTTQTRIVGVIPRNCRVKRVRFAGQGAVTGTTLTAQVVARTRTGGAGVNLLTAALDVKFGTEAAARVGVAGTLSAAGSRPDEDQLVEVTLTAASITGGPGDFVVEVEFAPRYKA